MRIVIASPIDPAARATLGKTHQLVDAVGVDEAELLRRIRGADVLVFRSGVAITAELLEAAGELKLLIRAGSGLDNVDLTEVGRRRIELVRIPQPGARAVAELTVGLMLALARNIVVADGLWRRGRWAKHELEGWLLHGKVLGIVGAGNIGTQVGELGFALGMRAMGCVRKPCPAAEHRLAVSNVRLAAFHEVVAEADFLTIHTPLTPETRGLIGGEVLSRMKSGAFLVNMARGGVIDEGALLESLRPGGRLRGAALDVHQNEGEGRISPLAGLPNVVLTPHIGASTRDTQAEIGVRIVASLNAFLARENPETPDTRTAA
jgi:D-3-phosphoglycerate dehydrogenase